MSWLHKHFYIVWSLLQWNMDINVLLWPLAYRSCASSSFTLICLLKKVNKPFFLYWCATWVFFQRCTNKLNVDFHQCKCKTLFPFEPYAQSRLTTENNLFLKTMFSFVCHNMNMTPNEIVFWWFLSAIYLFCSLE